MRDCLPSRGRGPAPEPPVLLQWGRRAQLLLGSAVRGGQLGLLHPLLQGQPQRGRVSVPFPCASPPLGLLPSPPRASGDPPPRCSCSSSGGLIPPPALTSAVILREKECSPVLREEASGPYVQHRCRIPVQDPWDHSQYVVSVRPKEEERLIKSSENSEFAPSLLRGLGSG